MAPWWPATGLSSAARTSSALASLTLRSSAMDLRMTAFGTRIHATRCEERTIFSSPCQLTCDCFVALQDADCANRYTSDSPKYAGVKNQSTCPLPDDVPSWTHDACTCAPSSFENQTECGACNGPIRCGKDKFCVGFDGSEVVCYGSATKCLWNENTCKTVSAQPTHAQRRLPL